MSDVNGEYMAADYTTRKVADNEVHYSTFSLWDTYRAAHPFYTLMVPERVDGFVNSLIESEQLIRFILCCIPTAFLILLKA